MYFVVIIDVQSCLISLQMFWYIIYVEKLMRNQSVVVFKAYVKFYGNQVMILKQMSKLNSQRDIIHAHLILFLHSEEGFTKNICSIFNFPNEIPIY